MILIGQYDSCFVRRVGIALAIYAMPFEHRPWSIFGDAERLGAINPLLRVPTLVLDDGMVLVETVAILDHLDRAMPEAVRLHPVSGAERSASMRVAALAGGIADLMVSLFYARNFHAEPSPVLITRRDGQIKAARALLEAERAATRTPFWFGNRIGHADIAVAATLRHLREALPEFDDMRSCPALAEHAARLEGMPVFREISQPFIAPA